MKHLNILFQNSNFESDWMSFCGVITGGKKRKENLFFLHKYPKVIIGTCGVLNEMLSEGLISTGRVGLLILDEIDQTVKMGYSRDLIGILNHVRNTQIMGFSATATNAVTQQIQKLSELNFTLLGWVTTHFLPDFYFYRSGFYRSFGQKSRFWSPIKILNDADFFR